MGTALDGVSASTMTDADLSHSIAGWLKAAPARLLVELHDETMRDHAARELSDLIVSELTMTYPEMVEASAPKFDFQWTRPIADQFIISNDGVPIKPRRQP